MIEQAQTITNTLLPWQSLTSFTASTTLSEKVFRVGNHLTFAAAAAAGVCKIGSRKIRQLRNKKEPNQDTTTDTLLVYGSYVAIALASRKIVATGIGYIVYPATTYSREGLKQLENGALSRLNARGFVTQKIVLHKSGVAYDATIIAHQETIYNGKWSIHALGNGMAMEQVMSPIAHENHLLGANTLLINGPSVGCSKGYPTRYQMGAGFEAGLQLLEKEVKASHIVFRGLSLGGGMKSEAILAHKFDLTKFKYLAISDRTFSRLSDVAATFTGSATKGLFYVTGVELDGVAGAEKLKALKIEHIIIQHSSKNSLGTDGVIADRVGLAQALEQCPTRTFLLSPQIPHNGALPLSINKQLSEKIQEFFKTA